ncbi:MAG: hypothetical protein ABEI96_00760 [Haloarculaceae archaeon]
MSDRPRHATTVTASVLLRLRGVVDGMSRRRDRAEVVAEELDRVAAELRTGEATLYGYRIKRDPKPASERGGVVYSGGFLTFEFEAEPKADASTSADSPSGSGERDS